MELLEKAKNIPTGNNRDKGLVPLADELALLKAYLNKEITQSQMSGALGLVHQSQTYVWTARVLRAGYQQGLIHID